MTVLLAPSNTWGFFLSTKTKGAVGQLKDLFMADRNGWSIRQLQEQTRLQSSQLSMALCYLTKRGVITRTKTGNNESSGPKLVWVYTYSGDIDGH